MQDFNDVTEFFTALAAHTCEVRQFASKDSQEEQALGFACACGEWFRLALNAVRSLKRPIRPYLATVPDREWTARRLNLDAEKLLTELKESGGWEQPDPGVTMFTLMAAAAGPPGNPMDEKLHKAMHSTHADQTAREDITRQLATTREGRTKLLQSMINPLDVWEKTNRAGIVNILAMLETIHQVETYARFDAERLGPLHAPGMEVFEGHTIDSLKARLYALRDKCSGVAGPGTGSA